MFKINHEYDYCIGDFCKLSSATCVVLLVVVKTL